MKITHWFEYPFIDKELPRKFYIGMREDAEYLDVKFTIWERIKLLFAGQIWIDKVKKCDDFLFLSQGMPQATNYTKVG